MLSIDIKCDFETMGPNFLVSVFLSSEWGLRIRSGLSKKQADVTPKNVPPIIKITLVERYFGWTTETLNLINRSIDTKETNFSYYFQRPISTDLSINTAHTRNSYTRKKNKLWLDLRCNL